jgi:hypothetical protein
MVIEVTFDVTDVYISTTVSPVYVSVSFEAPSGGGAAVWGSITGTLSDQTDLQTALDAKFDDPTGTSLQYIDGTGALQTFPLTLPVLQEVRNQTGATLAAGTVVYINGATGNKPTVTKAIATGDATSAQTLGMVSASIANNGVGYVVVIGTCSGLDTSAYTEGQQLYLSYTTAGAVTTTKPYAPNHLVYVGIVTRSHPTLGTVEVRVQNGYELDEIHNVDALNPNNNDGLFYNTSTSLWEHKQISTVLGYAPEQPLTFNSPLSRSTNAVSIPQATGSVNGYLSSTDWTTFNNKQNALGYTPANSATTLTINGVTYDLSANRSWTISAGISGSGASGQVAYWTGASSQSGSNSLFWDAANGRLGIGTNAPEVGKIIDVVFDEPTLGGRGIRIRNTNTTGYSELIFDNNRTPTGTGRFVFGLGGETSGAPDTAYFFLRLNSSLLFGTNNLERARFTGAGNLLLNTTTDSGQRLQVIGDTLLKGSGNTSGTTALTVQNSDGTALLRVRNDGVVNSPIGFFVGGTSSQASIRASDTGNTATLIITSSAVPTTTNISDVLISNGQGEIAITSGTRNLLHISRGFNPTSGTGTYRMLNLDGTINQTGGANGITRGLYVNPTLTAAADWRSVEWSNNSGWGLYGAGSAPNYLSGNLLIGSTNNFAKLYVGGITATASAQSFIFSQPSITGALTDLYSFISSIVGNLAVNVTNAYHFRASQSGLSTSTITNQFGFHAENSITGATNNYGFYGNIPSATGRWNLYMNGTAANYMNGELLLGSTTNTGEKLQVTGTAVIKDITTSSVASALLQLSSTTKGFLPPRMTTTQKNAISSPAAGLVVYDTTLAKLCVYTTSWETITSV